MAKFVDAGADLDVLEALVGETDFESLKDEALQLVKLTGGQAEQRGYDLLLRAYNKAAGKRLVA